MEEINKVQPIERMARISREEFGKRLDEILDIVDKDNVGYVISDVGKGDIVLCPARWFEGLYDRDFGCIINCALRYAIGRNAYIPSVVISFIRNHMDVLDAKTTSAIISDIEREAESEALNERDEWLKLRDDLKARYETMPI